MLIIYFLQILERLLLFVLYINHKVVYVVCILEKYVQGSWIFIYSLSCFIKITPKPYYA
jgi:hypothetical protein